jgi:hypothetical protein
MRKLILTALLATSSVAFAVPPIKTVTMPETPAVEPINAKEFKDLEKMFSTLFGNTDTTPIDPLRLSLAKQTTAQIMPDGIYSKLMNGMFDKLLGTILAQPGGMSDLEISLISGVEIAEGGLDESKRKAITALLDPNHSARAAAMQTSFKPLMDKIATTIEPPMREGLARAYARKFSVEQLTEMNGFFATPTGSLYASESFLLQADPEVMQATFSALPTLMAELTNPGNEYEANLSAIPAARTLDELSAKEKGSLAKLLGTSVDKLSASGAVQENDAEFDAMAEAAIDAAAAPDPFANETGEEPWWDRTNWDKADQKKIADLESKSSTLAEQSEAASTVSYNFETEIMLRIRERYLAKGWKPSEVSK